MTHPSEDPDLPVLAVIDQIRAALRDDHGCVLIAPPGTGKTTGVPPALLTEPWLADQRIVMLEPRRLAARSGAARMAATHGQRAGESFGYSVRGEARISAATRVEVVTEGLFLRRLQHDPTLEGVGAVIFDEFHERSLDSDLALTLLCDARGSLRPDLRVMVMSATLDPGPVADLLAVPTIAATAPIHPVRTHYRPGSVHEPLENRVAEVVAEALRSEPGDVLVFLPGRPEIRRTRRVLEDRFAGGAASTQPRLVELHGSLSSVEQQLALEPDPNGRRRVVLATALAETSVTVPGVRVVVDSGRRRTTVVDPYSGLAGLVTVAVSRAGADQRRGRAGRTAPGAAYRLWSPEDERHRRASDPPEILSADLAPLLLQLRAWGVVDPAELRWLDPPPRLGLERAQQLLDLLGACDGSGRLNGQGRRLAEIGFHPRLAAIALHGVSLGHGDLAAEVCALLETAGPGSVDLLDRLEALHGGRADGELGRALRQWRATVRSLARQADTPTPARTESLEGLPVADLVVAGFPDRIARRRDAARNDGSGRSRTVFQVRSGGEVTVPEDHPLARAKWLLALDVDAESQRLHLAASVVDRWVKERFASEFTTRDTVEWNDRSATIEAKRTTYLGVIKVNETTLAEPPDELLAEALAAAFAKRGLDVFGRLGEAAELRARVALVSAAVPRRMGDPAAWPDFSDEALLADLPGWLGSHHGRLTGPEDLERVDVRSLLYERLSWEQRNVLDELAPTTWSLVTGRKVRLRYDRGEGDEAQVTAAVRLADAFGTDVHPTVLAGRLPVVVELLSPAGRPVQRTTDLPGFWRGSYREVRAQLRGRYPKHPWPEDPQNRPERR